MVNLRHLIDYVVHINYYTSQSCSVYTQLISYSASCIRNRDHIIKVMELYCLTRNIILSGRVKISWSRAATNITWMVARFSILVGGVVTWPIHPTQHSPIPRWVFTLAYLAVPVRSSHVTNTHNTPLTYSKMGVHTSVSSCSCQVLVFLVGNVEVGSWTPEPLS